MAPRRRTSSTGHEHQGLAGRNRRLLNSDTSIAPRSNTLLTSTQAKSHSSVLGTMKAGSGSNTPAAEPDPKAWFDSNVSEASAARQYLLDSATQLLKHANSARPLSGEPYQLDTFLTFEGSAQNTVVTPTQALIPGLLHADKFIYLSPDQLNQANALSTTHPGVETQMPDMTPQFHVISPAVAANLALAREAIDLVKALLPGGAGNQIKDLAATGGESYLRSSLSFVYSGSPAMQAFLAIPYQGGFCDAQASLTYQLLSQNPSLKDSQIDIVHGNRDIKHVFVVIRGDTPDKDIVVDSWTPFASPTFVKDALPMHRTLLGATGNIRESKPAGTIAPTLPIEEALRRQSLIKKYSSISERFRDEKSRDPDTEIMQTLEPKGERWDVPFSGNPNVRYEVRDASGQQLTDFPLRFDMQRPGLGRQPER